MRKRRRSRPEMKLPISERALNRLEKRRRRIEGLRRLADAASDSDHSVIGEPANNTTSTGRKNANSIEAPLTSQGISSPLGQFDMDISPTQHLPNRVHEIVIDLTTGQDNEEKHIVRKKAPATPTPTYSEVCGYLNPISKEDEARLRKCFKQDDDDIIVYLQDSNIPILAKSFRTLQHSNWLDDEIINGFAGMVTSRSKYYHSSRKDSDADAPSTHMFSSFFFTRLCRGNGSIDYDSVRRWTSRANIDVTKYTLLIFPIHVNKNHWALCTVDIQSKEFFYLDTLYHTDKVGAVKCIMKWLHAELCNRKGQTVAEQYNVAEWPVHTNKYRALNGENLELKTIPRQSNSSSCGVLTLKIADCISLRSPTYFLQKHSSLLRKKIALDILRTYLPF